MDIDTHQHFWQYNPAEHTWMSAGMPGLKRDLLPPDLKPLLDANGIGGMWRCRRARAWPRPSGC